MTKTVKEQLAEAGVTIRDVTHFGAVPLASNQNPDRAAQNKYRNEPVDDPEDGWFQSGFEHETWRELKLREREGEISDLQRQVRFSLYVGGVFIADYLSDFVYYEDGKLVVADSKGTMTQVYVMKRALMWACHGIRIREYTKKGIASPVKFRMQKGV